MTAPAAPRISVFTDGEVVLVRWQPVPNATDYNVYVADAADNVFGIEDQVPDDDIEADGWFRTYLTHLAGVVNIRVTALNAGAEESVASNTKQRSISGNHSVHRHYSGAPHAVR